jgi:hypothetical protein
MNRDELSSVVAGFRAARVEAEPLSRKGRVHLAHAVGRVLLFLPTDSRCLVRSLVLLALLERRGVASMLVIGVRAEPEFAAHAWIEYEGETLLPSGGGQYARMVEI